MSGGEPHPRSESLTEAAFELVDRMESGRLEPGFSTRVSRGSSHGLVEVIEDPWSPSSNLLSVRMAIMNAPRSDGERFWRTLAELNTRLLGRASFALATDGVVWLMSSHPIVDLDPGEMLDLVLWTANMADELDDQLLDEFGRELAI